MDAAEIISNLRDQTRDELIASINEFGTQLHQLGVQVQPNPFELACKVSALIDFLMESNLITFGEWEMIYLRRHLAELMLLLPHAQETKDKMQREAIRQHILGPGDPKFGTR